MHQLQKLSHRHEEILMWLMLNPNKSQGECARELGYTDAWVSQIINSDIFQARLAELREQDFELNVLSLREKLSAAADLAIDKMMERLEVETDIDKIRNVGDTALKRLGYGTPANPAQVAIGGRIINNTLIVDGASKAALEQSRQVLDYVKRNTAPLAAEDDQPRDESGRVTNRSASIDSTAEVVQEGTESA